MVTGIEILERAAASLVSSELMKSSYLKTFDFMPDYRDGEGRLTFNSKLTHEVNGERFITILEPLFTRVDLKRFTKEEWERYLLRKVHGLRAYMGQISEKES